ncbi:RE1-silencing transcription factor-like [Zophobas morio]|uniref:RE1-silencing transcription factor-like n=1 Tax=Zophobas morio TaxID=2755281 RepID=UPI0030836983
MSIFEHSEKSVGLTPLPSFNCENAELETYDCEDCNFQTELTVFYKKHIKERHTPKREDSPSEEFTIHEYNCEECDFETHCCINWLRHTCFRNTENLQLRCAAKSNHQETPVAHNVGNTIKHVKKRITVYKYQCNQCPYIAKQSSHLKQHINANHLPEKEIKWYQCQKCPYKAKQDSHLKNHINVHHSDGNDIKWYHCDQCTFKTKSSSNLRRHTIAWHLNEQDITWHQCQKCPYKAKRKESLTSHVVAQHLSEAEITWFECNECPFKAKRKTSLQNHVKVRHLSVRDVWRHNNTRVKQSKDKSSRSVAVSIPARIAWRRGFESHRGTTFFSAFPHW